MEPVKSYTKIAENVYMFDLSSKVDATNVNTTYNNARLYKLSGQNEKALELYKLCEQMDPDTDLMYQLYINIALLHTTLNDPYEIILSYYQKVFKLCNSKAEPYYYFALYCNQHKLYEKTYEILKDAIKTTTRDIHNKLLYDELAVACYWLKNYDESVEYINKIISDPELEHIRPRLLQNKSFALDAILNLHDNP